MTGERERRRQRREEIEERQIQEDLEKAENDSPAKRRRRRAKKNGGSSSKVRIVSRPTTRKIPDEPKEVEFPEKVEDLPKNIRKSVDDHFFAGLIQVMEEGYSLTITKEGDSTWKVALHPEEETKKMFKLTGKAYMDEILSDEYQEFMEEWDSLTEEEKIEVAKKAGAEWDEVKNPRINLMKCASAYREVLGIEKYKPEYRSFSARKAIRG